MTPVIILQITRAIRLVIPVETWQLCNSDAQLPEHVQEACEGIAAAILQALVWVM